MPNNVLPFTVGVEIEFNCRENPGVAIPCNWIEKRDGSCGFEVNSPILRTVKDLETVKVVCDFLKENAHNDARCGLHVHLGMQDVHDLSMKYRLFRFCAHFEKEFFSIADETRRNNNFTRHLSSGILTGIRSGMGWGSWSAVDDRYHWVNGRNMGSGGNKTTVEFRLMRSSFDHKYVTGWICFLLCVATYATRDRTRFDWEVSSVRPGDTLKLLDWIHHAKVLEDLGKIYATAVTWMENRSMEFAR